MSNATLPLLFGALFSLSHYSPLFFLSLSSISISLGFFQIPWRSLQKADSYKAIFTLRFGSVVDNPPLSRSVSSKSDSILCQRALRILLRFVTIDPFDLIWILLFCSLRFDSRRHLSCIGESDLRTSAIGFRTRAIGFRTSAKMMVDTSAEKRVSLVDMPPEKVDDGGYIGGGWKNDDGSLSCGYCSFRGKRSTMEDFYDVKASIIEGQRVCMFGIFDGHGGSRAAEYLKEHLFDNLMKHPQFLTDTKLALSETYKQTDVAFLESERDTYRDDGSTASTAVLVGNHLYVANVGDSRTIVSKAGKAIALSDDHKPNRSDERKRIESAGGVIMWAGTWRVGGVLAMSRAFGNRMLKQFVVAEPEIQDLEIDHEAEFLVLASDGLWDVVPNEDTVSLAQSEEKPEAAARKLTDTAFSRGSADNITCIVVKFRHDKSESAKTESKAMDESEPEPNPKAELEPQSNPNAEPETESSSKAELKPKPDAIPDPKAETKPETKGEKAGE
ncbi:putative protein phosphatase 2C 76 [Cardamine amara subsp. amara]|uniref:protein-serine/threonine phosphatase n=1 Tax=Cardamine amara subsp. amara TaxID=228776 RepID=A0ABD1AIT3_CARAN